MATAGELGRRTRPPGERVQALSFVVGQGDGGRGVASRHIVTPRRSWHPLPSSMPDSRHMTLPQPSCGLPSTKATEVLLRQLISLRGRQTVPADGLHAVPSHARDRTRTLQTEVVLTAGRALVRPNGGTTARPARRPAVPCDHASTRRRGCSDRGRCLVRPRDGTNGQRRRRPASPRGLCCT